MSFHSSPAPDTVTDWRPAPAGPSELTNASNSSSPSAVVRGPVVVVPWPLTDVSISMTKHGPSSAGFCTVTSTGAEVPTLPEVSVACAVSLWLPLLAPVVSQLIAYGADVTAAPSALPSR